jgi:NAD(P)H-hydrate epimerase
MPYQRQQLDSVVVTASQMQQIEALIFDSGMPIPALMEKAASLSAIKIQSLYPQEKTSAVGILVGPGHNGGDALVIARELYLQGYQVWVYQPLPKMKDLTSAHSLYAHNLGISFIDNLDEFLNADLLIDGLFGFGLERSLSGNLAELVRKVNHSGIPIVSIDIASGIHTDTGEVLGVAVKATYTLCLGLWKKAFFQDQALEYLGKVERIDLGIPPQFVEKILGKPTPIQKITSNFVQECLPLPRPVTTHKYKQGHLLLVCGSRQFSGAAILAGLGARSSGIGMLSIAVPKSLKFGLISYLPEALIIECSETETGAIAALPELDWHKYQAIGCGCGLTREASSIVTTVFHTSLPLILDADGLNILAEMDVVNRLNSRQSSTILTPHLGEFKRLFPNLNLDEFRGDRLSLTQQAVELSRAIILLKGARTIIASPEGKANLIGESSSSLAKGGSGDVLTGLIAGLVAQTSKSDQNLDSIVATGAWLHQQAAILAAKERTELGVDGVTLSEFILKVVTKVIAKTDG